MNTDNRLMSGTSMSREFEHLVEAFGYTLDDMQWFTVNAMKSAFIPFDERLAMINDVIKPGYAELKSEWLFRQTACDQRFCRRSSACLCEFRSGREHRTPGRFRAYFAVCGTRPDACLRSWTAQAPVHKD